MCTEITDYADKYPTHPELRLLLETALTTWLDDLPIIPTDYSTELSELITQQNEIGWKQILYGRFVKPWIGIQELFLASQSSRGHKSGNKWLSGIVQIIWKQIQKA